VVEARRAVETGAANPAAGQGRRALDAAARRQPWQISPAWPAQHRLTAAGAAQLACLPPPYNIEAIVQQARAEI